MSNSAAAKRAQPASPAIIMKRAGPPGTDLRCQAKVAIAVATAAAIRNGIASGLPCVVMVARPMGLPPVDEEQRRSGSILLNQLT